MRQAVKFNFRFNLIRFCTKPFSWSVKQCGGYIYRLRTYYNKDNTKNRSFEYWDRVILASIIVCDFSSSSSSTLQDVKWLETSFFFFFLVNGTIFTGFFFFFFFSLSFLFIRLLQQSCIRWMALLWDHDDQCCRPNMKSNNNRIFYCTHQQHKWKKNNNNNNQPFGIHCDWIQKAWIRVGVILFHRFSRK